MSVGDLFKEGSAKAGRCSTDYIRNAPLSRPLICDIPTLAASVGGDVPISRAIQVTLRILPPRRFQGIPEYARKLDPVGMLIFDLSAVWAREPLRTRLCLPQGVQCLAPGAATLKNNLIEIQLLQG